MATSSSSGAAERLARPNILELQPYRCARDDYSEGILLDANENSLGPPIDSTMTLERYPDPYQVPLKKLLCDHRGHDLSPANVFVGVGSDEAIDLLMRVFCAPGKDKIIITPPTYGMYKVCAKINDLEVVSVPLTPEFDLVVDDVVNAITSETKLLFLCSPGNPTSKALPLSDMRAILDTSAAKQCLVVVDEAYVDFSDCTAVGLIHEYDNVVVLQTLSKAFGLAAIRCGFCLGPPDVIQLLNNCKAPYNVNQLTSELALSVFDTGLPKLKENIDTLLKERDLLSKALEALPIVVRVYHSDANFILFRLKKNAQKVYQKMADEGVVTRYRGHELHCNECIRVSVGTATDNSQFLKLLHSVYKELDV